MTPSKTNVEPLMVYEVDINEIRPVTWRVEARSRTEAIEKARNGDGQEVQLVDFVDGEVVDVRNV